MYQRDTYESHATTDHELFYPQLGVNVLLDGGRRRTKNLYGVIQDKSGSDLFHLRDGFEIKMKS